MTTIGTTWRRWMEPRWRARATWCGFAVLLLAGVLLVAATSNGLVTAARFATLRQDQAELRAFLQRMPKGADLHVHLSGSIYAERAIALAAADGLCIRLNDLAVTEAPCGEADGTVPAARALTEQSLYDRVVNAMSMRAFVPSSAVTSGHDQFFAAFPKFGQVSDRNTAALTVDLLRRYEAENTHYTELMLSFGSRAQRAAMVTAIGDERDIAAAWAKARQAGFGDAVAAARAQVVALVARIEELRHCDGGAKPGCGVRFRFIAQVNRNNPWPDVLVQTAIAAELVRTEPWVVGLNFVGPEDWHIARADYSDHMRMIALLARDVPVALHAGELWIGLVPPEDLAFHIGEAVTVAGARRIGHGVSLAFEHRMPELLDEMRRRDVAIEINLSSNDLILGVRGRQQPLLTYVRAGVPVLLSTDDAGVSRIDLTNEYVRAARDYALGYRALKAMARAALGHSFLKAGDKQDELARFDRAATAFERLEARRLTLPRRMTILVFALLGLPEPAITSLSAYQLSEP